MRSMKITQDGKMVVVETSTGVRSTGASVESALQKLDLTDLIQLEDLEPFARIFARIREQDGKSNIGRGVASA